MKTYKVTVDKDGTTRWYNERGEYHRENGPAVEWSNGYKSWYINGKRHREDGPAIEHVEGGKSWFINGKLHREDGPAVEYFDGDKDWYLNGKLHRENGPAVEYADGGKDWYLNGDKLTEEEFKNFGEKMKHTVKTTPKEVLKKEWEKALLEYDIDTHDKILSMTDDFVQSNRNEGQTYTCYHYDMMADFALHILETFNTKEK